MRSQEINEDGNLSYEGLADNDYHHREGINPHGEYNTISLMEFLH
jgi:hypothetical protein